MVTTQTYNFDPSAGDIIENAFSMVGVRRANLTNEHLVNAAYQANLTGVDFTNRNPNRWQMEEVPFTLSAGIKTYTFAREVVAVSCVVIDQTPPPSPATPITRVLGPLSAVDYASISNKEQRGTPTSYFFSLLTPLPTLTLWLVPSDIPAYVMKVQTFKQQQDTNLAGGLTVDTPYRFLDALTTGIAARLARVYPDPARPNLVTELKQEYAEKFQLAAGLDQERVPLRLGPILSGYFS